MPSDKQLKILRHSLGLTRSKEPYSNHFITGEGSKDHPDCMALVAEGLMVRHAIPQNLGGSDLFLVTDAGKVACGVVPSQPPSAGLVDCGFVDYLKRFIEPKRTAGVPAAGGWRVDLEATAQNQRDLEAIAEPADEAQRKADERMRHDYPILQQFHSKHALGALSAPSCLCCGHQTGPDRPIAVQHMELPAIVVCKLCKDAAAGVPVAPTSLSDAQIEAFLPQVRHRPGMVGYACYSFGDVAAAIRAALGVPVVGGETFSGKTL